NSRRLPFGDVTSLSNSIRVLSIDEAETSKRILELSSALRLPLIFQEREGVEDGGFASYGVNYRESYRRAATFIDKILKGAAPGELPIEFSTKIETRDQSQDRKGAWPHCATRLARPRRRGDRISGAMSVYDPKRTFRHRKFYGTSVQRDCKADFWRNGQRTC